MSVLSKIKQYNKDYGMKYTMRKVYYRYQIKYKLGKKYFPIEISKSVRKEQEEWKPDNDYTISIVVPLYNTPENFLRDMIESVIWQTYGGWELCLADASDAFHQNQIEAIVKEYQKSDERIKYRKLVSNDGISNNTNSALIMAQGQFIGLMDHDDILHPSALYWVMQEIIKYGADFVYTDELSFVKDTEHVQSVHLKPDFKQESFRNNNYICHFTVFEKDLLERTGRFRKKYDGSQDYDLFLRLTSEAGVIRHIPKVLYYWRLHSGSSASGVAAKPYVVEAGRRALVEYLRHSTEGAIVESSKAHPSFYKVTYHVPESSRVYIIVQDEDTEQWVKKSIKDLKADIKISLVERFEKNGDFEKISLADIEMYDYILFVRKGYKPENDGSEWLIELLQCLQPVDNKAASVMVYNEDATIYHAGYCYNSQWNEKIRSLYKNMPRKEAGYMNKLEFRQNVSLLGGAVLAVKNEIYTNWIKDNYDKINNRWNGFDIWSDQAWFSMCFIAQRNFGDCVLSPYAPFINESDIHDDEFNQLKLSEDAWKKFMTEWKEVMNEHDKCYNKGMDIFGKYYFLW